MSDLVSGRGRTLRTPELRELLDRGDVTVGRFISVRRGFARVELLVPGRAMTVTVVDPKP
jgi:hypothetical protein